jgi:hypothetical protein
MKRRNHITDLRRLETGTGAQVDMSEGAALNVTPNGRDDRIQAISSSAE